jgi:cytoskeletal protein CcmA (bactofilin family)
MWKPSQSGSVTPSFNPEPSRPSAPALSSEPANRAPVSAGDQASIGKGLIIKGEITGTESLFIDGKVEGTIALPGNRVTIGRNGQVASSITGDVTAARISIEDGAFFKGGIDIKKADAKPPADAKPSTDAKPLALASAASESSKPALL